MQATDAAINSPVGPKNAPPNYSSVRPLVRRCLAWGGLVVISVICFFAVWLFVQDRPLRQMRAALRNQNWQEGVRLAVGYLAKHPQDAEAWKVAAHSYAAMGQYAAAEACLAKAGDDLSPADLRLRADALIHLDQNSQAVQVLRELLAFGDDPTVLRGLSILEFRRGYHEEAFQLAARMSQFEEHAATAWYLQATFHSATRSHMEAIKCLQKALEINPQADRCGLPPETVLWYVGATLLDMGRPDESRPYFHRALEHAKTADIYWSLGDAEEGCGDLVAAEAAWRNALQIDPNYSEAMFALAKLALKQNRPEEAIDWLLLTQRSGKKTLAVESALARAYARLGQTELAEMHSKRAEEIQNENEARAQEETLLANYPQNVHSRMILTRRAIERGNIKEASDLLDDALRNYPDNQQLLHLRQILNESRD